MTLIAAIALIAFGSVIAGGKKHKSKPKFVNLVPATFTPVETSTHNNNADPACADFKLSNQPSENNGDLNAETGAFMRDFNLPQGARLLSLSMFANDNSDQEAYVFLLRKKLQDGLSPQFDGYEVIGDTATSGAENGVMRKFTDATITKPTLDPQNYSYFVELVVCDAIEPFSIQLKYR